MYLYYLNWFLLLFNGKVNLTKYWKVKERQSFNHLFYEVVGKSIWEWVGFLKMIQRYLCKKGLLERTFLKHTFFWNITFLHGLADAQFQKNKIKNKNVLLCSKLTKIVGNSPLYWNVLWSSISYNQNYKVLLPVNNFINTEPQPELSSVIS